MPPTRTRLPAAAGAAGCRCLAPEAMPRSRLRATCSACDESSGELLTGARHPHARMYGHAARCVDLPADCCASELKTRTRARRRPWVRFLSCRRYGLIVPPAATCSQGLMLATLLAACCLLLAASLPCSCCMKECLRVLQRMLHAARSSAQGPVATASWRSATASLPPLATRL